MSFYVVTTKSRSRLHPRASAALGFSTLVPGAVHELDPEVAEPFCAHTDEVVVGQKTDVRTHELVDITRPVERPGFLKKISKAKAKKAADALAELGDIAGDEAGDESE